MNGYARKLEARLGMINSYLDVSEEPSLLALARQKLKVEITTMSFDGKAKSLGAFSFFSSAASFVVRYPFHSPPSSSVRPPARPFPMAL